MNNCFRGPVGNGVLQNTLPSDTACITNSYTYSNSNCNTENIQGNNVNDDNLQNALYNFIR